MRNKRTLISSLLLTFCATIQMFGWGQKGHDVTAYIAQQHLTPATQAAVNKVFDGHSLVYWANWLDNASHTPEYAYTKTWHYKNVNEGVDYDAMSPHPKGDAVTAIKTAVEKLGSHDADVDSVLWLKILVHVVGDLHQPMHLGHATDLGGNRVDVKFFNQNKNLHSVWDTNLVESAHKWGYAEWAEQVDILTPQQEQQVLQGTVDNWARECVAIAAQVYKNTPAGSKIEYNQIAQAAPVIENQFVKGGLRLAHLLNLIYDPEYAAAFAQ